MILVIEGIVMCFVLLIICVIGIANGPVGLVVFYEQEVKDRVVELGLTTYERIKRNKIITFIALLVPMFILVPYMVYGINGVTDFKSGAFQDLYNKYQDTETNPVTEPIEKMYIQYTFSSEKMLKYHI